jgi:hypothetical protein
VPQTFLIIQVRFLQQSLIYISCISAVNMTMPCKLCHRGFTAGDMLVLFNAGNKAVGIMKAGQTFTIEPMVNAGKFMYYIAPSNPISYDLQFKNFSLTPEH